MPALVAGIHAAPLDEITQVCCTGSAWMTATSPAMTQRDGVRNQSIFL